MDQVNKKIEKLYKPIDDDIIFSLIIPAIFLITFAIIIIQLYIKTTLKESNFNWNENKCVPKYMFVSGFINPTPEKSALTSTYDNFNQCVTEYKYS